MFDIFSDKLGELIAGYGPRLIFAVVVLVVGWLIALAIARGVRAGLHRLKLDEGLGRWLAEEEKPKPVTAERTIARVVYYVLVVLLLVAVVQILSFTVAVVPVNAMLEEVGSYLPNLIGAALLLLLAWVLATILRALVYKAMAAAKVDEWVSGAIDREVGKPMLMARSLSTAVYWIVFVVFLPAIVGALTLNGLLSPIQSMLTPALNFLPNLVSAALILLVGLFAAHLVRRIVTNLLVVAGADRLSERIGLDKGLGERRLSGLLGLIAFILVLVPVLAATFGALKMEAITRPASNMLNAIVMAVPNIFGALLLLVVAYVAGRVVAQLAANLLSAIGFNKLLSVLGIGKEPVPGERTLSEIAGSLVLVGIMLVASLEALNIMEFDLAADLLSEFLVFTGNVVLGLLIFAVGLYLANLAANALRGERTAGLPLLPLAARVSILVMAGGMALRQMGLAGDVVLLAFGLLFGSIAVAFAIAFGVGGIKFATGKIEEWLHSQRPTPPRL